ncbi:hypothetical protein [Candidatus Hepatobacter penaei]|uniref:hypothetical protein n=1 Tax=Candidatus Hepatobacter penaei TaxID=1274402 RepID=UPI0004F3BC65|nr:hypothetical protein [Candidatus Hepatobacter penaei]
MNFEPEELLFPNAPLLALINVNGFSYMTHHGKTGDIHPPRPHRPSLGGATHNGKDGTAS